MSIARVNGTHIPADNTAAQGTSETPPASGHHRHHEQAKSHKSTNRARTKRKRGADSQDGVDESGASEELLQMLEEHLQRNPEIVMRAGERRSGDQGGSGRGQQDDERSSASEALSTRRLRFARGSAGTDDVSEAARHTEQALHAARRAQAAQRPPASSTYQVLAAMRDFLMLPGAAVHTPAALAGVRARLIKATGTPTERAPARQHSINLLLPLMQLNLKRVRTEDERALAIARINSLLGRRRVGI